MEQLLEDNRRLFGLMRTCSHCQHTQAGVHPCPTHKPMVEVLHARWLVFINIANRPPD